MTPRVCGSKVQVLFLTLQHSLCVLEYSDPLLRACLGSGMQRGPSVHSQLGRYRAIEMPLAAVSRAHHATGTELALSSVGFPSFCLGPLCVVVNPFSF